MLLCFVQVGLWIEFPVQRRLCPIFGKIIDPGKWDITVRVSGHRISTIFSQVDSWSMNPRV